MVIRSGLIEEEEDFQQGGFWEGENRELFWETEGMRGCDKSYFWEKEARKEMVERKKAEQASLEELSRRWFSGKQE